MLIWMGAQIVFAATIASSVGQRIVGLRLERVTGGYAGLVRPIIRTLLLALIIPALIWDADQRVIVEKRVGDHGRDHPVDRQTGYPATRPRDRTRPAPRSSEPATGPVLISGFGIRRTRVGHGFSVPAADLCNMRETLVSPVRNPIPIGSMWLHPPAIAT
jgi:hypothetical protein